LRVKEKRLRNKLKRDLQNEHKMKRKLEKENIFLKSERVKTESELKSSKKDRINMEIILKMQHHILQKFNPKMLQICPQFISEKKSAFIINEQDFTLHRDKVLGKGGFAEVFQGQLKGKTVAIKRMDIPHEYAKMLFNEISTMIACENHPNIVNLLAVAFGDISEISLQVYIIMEILEKDLKKLIHKERTKLSLKEKYKILMDVLKGLDHLHEMNYVHCDIKLQNILIDKVFNAKISDFGLAKTLRSGNTKNTITYGFSERTSSFEYLVEEKVSTKADIWSFGILMYELLSEKVAWETLSGPQAVAKISVKTPFYSCNEKIGTCADTIIEKCLNYDYTKRPTAKELILEINSLPI
jgi:serine/threonine protein kinase